MPEVEIYEAYAQLNEDQLLYEGLLDTYGMNNARALVKFKKKWPHVLWNY